MRTTAPFIVALILPSACSDRSTVVEEEENSGQIGASSGPNPNFDGQSAGDAFGEPTPSREGDGAGADDSGQAAPDTDTPPG